MLFYHQFKIYLEVSLFKLYMVACAFWNIKPYLIFNPLSERPEQIYVYPPPSQGNNTYSNPQLFSLTIVMLVPE